MSTDTKFELFYFPIRGRAEQIRLLFALAQVEFTDTPVTDWPARKPTVPLGQLPILKETSASGELLIPQSCTILRHLARSFALYGTGERQHTIADYVCDTAYDWRGQLIPVVFSANYKTDAATIEKYWTQTLPGRLASVEWLLEHSARPESGFFVGESPTFADVVMFEVLDANLNQKPDCLDGHPKVMGFVERFRALPQIAAYLAKRPALPR